MSSIVGPYAGVENDYRRERITESFQHHRKTGDAGSSTAGPPRARPSRPPSTGSASECPQPPGSSVSSLRRVEPRALSLVPAMMGHVPPLADIRGPLVGRAAELDRLAGLVGCSTPGAAAQPRGAVLLAGDAGVGKTRLLAELRDRAVAAGWRVARRALPRLRRQRPALPAVHRGLRPARRRAARRWPRLARRGRPGARPAACPAAGCCSEQPSPPTTRAEPASTAPTSSTPSTPPRAARPSRAPLLLVVEDVHWADQSTRDLLSFLFARRFDAPGRVVASYRSDDLHRRHPLRTAGRRVVPAARRAAGVQLDPLPDDDVRAPGARRCTRRRCPSASCAASSSGPRATRSSPRSWSARPRWAPDALPDDLADLLLVRLDRLDDDARHVVRAAAGRRPPGAATLLLAARRRRPDGVARRGPARRGRAATSWCRSAATATRSGTPCSPRRSTTTCCRASGSGCTRRTPRRCSSGGVGGTAAELARHARAAHDLADRGRAPASQAGDEAMAVGGPGRGRPPLRARARAGRPTPTSTATSTWST